jgi:hypothetical protein
MLSQREQNELRTYLIGHPTEFSGWVNGRRPAKDLTEWDLIGPVIAIAAFLRDLDGTLKAIEGLLERLRTLYRFVTGDTAGKLTAAEMVLGLVAHRSLTASAGLSEKEIAERSGLKPGEVEVAVKTLAERGAIRLSGEVWVFPHRNADLA